MYEEEIAAYQKHKHLVSAAAELGIPFQSLYSRLRKVGVPVTGDKARYGAMRDKLACVGEAIFQNIVPSAQNQNDTQFQAKVDFIADGFGVDVKTSRLRDGGSGAMRWGFSLKKQRRVADFFVLICLRAGTNEAERFYLVPDELLRDNIQTISIPLGKSKWGLFEVGEDTLRETFSSENG